MVTKYQSSRLLGLMLVSKYSQFNISPFLKILRFDGISVRSLASDSDRLTRYRIFEFVLEDLTIHKLLSLQLWQSETFQLDTESSSSSRRVGARYIACACNLITASFSLQFYFSNAHNCCHCTRKKYHTTMILPIHSSTVESRFEIFSYFKHKKNLEKA